MTGAAWRIRWLLELDAIFGRAPMGWWLAHVAASRSGAGQQPSLHSPLATPAASVCRGMKNAQVPHRPVKSRMSP